MDRHYQLDLARLAGLSSLVQLEKSVLSPLHFPGAAALTLEQLNQLRAAGMVDANDLISVEARPLMDTLAVTQAFARLHLSGPGQYLDYAVYFGQAEAGNVSINTTQQGVDLVFPAEPAGYLDRIVATTGNSAHKNQDWEVTLPPYEALALAVLMDQRRRAVLKAIAEDKPALPAPSDPIALTQVINATVDVPQWLVSVVKNTGLIPFPLTPAQLQPAFQALIVKGLAWQDRAQIFMAQPALMLADRMLLVSNVITLDAAHANSQGAVASRRCIHLQSSLAEILRVELVEGQVHLQCISAQQMLDTLDHYLTDAEAVPPVPLIKSELYLSIVAGAGMGLTFPLNGDLVIGRGQDCTIHLLDVKASRHHAGIRKLDKGIEIADLGSTNGTKLNGEFITAATLLKADDVITVGVTQFKVMIGTPPERLPEMEATVYAGGLGGVKPPLAQPDVPSEPMVLPSAIPPLEPIPAMQPVPPAQPVAPLPVTAPLPPLPVEPELSAPPVIETLPLEQPVIPEIPFTPAIPPAPPAPPEATSGQEATQPPLAAGEPVLKAVPDVRRCPNCANEVNQAARFCGYCGSRL